jgi:exonuclease III
MQKFLISYELHNKRLLKLRIKGKYTNITLINAYGPTEGKSEETKEQFYDELQSVFDKTPKNELTIILGVINAKLGENLHTRK